MSLTNLACTFVDDIETLRQFLSKVTALAPNESCLSIAVEGHCQSPTEKHNQATVSLLNIYVGACHHTYMIDIHSLQSAAFKTTIFMKSGACQAVATNENNDDSGFFDDTTDDTPGSSSTIISLAAILSSPHLPKLVFDICSASYALYTCFDIKLQGVKDIQLLELAARPEGHRKFLMSFDKCVDIFSPLAGMKEVDKMQWKLERMQGRNLLAAYARGDLGRGRQRNIGRMLQGEVDDQGVWAERPLDHKLIKYALAKVRVLQGLEELFCGRLGNREDGYGRSWKQRAEWETFRRIEETWENDYVLAQNRDGREYGPWKD